MGSAAAAINAPIIERRTPQASGLIRITLEVPATYRFCAGQYLNVLHPDGMQIPLSIASAPAALPNLELHYQPTPGDALSAAMDACLTGSALRVSDALGSVRCPASSTSLTVIAGGSGASLAFSCAHARYPERGSSQTQVLWCVDEEKDFYGIEVLAERCALHQVADSRRDQDNQALALLATLPQTERYILSGSPAFVYVMTDVLTECGITTDRLQSDVFSYAPRETPLRKT